MINRDLFIARFKDVTGNDSISEISEKLGFSSDDVVKSWRRKNGALPTYENLALICDVYPVTPDYLLGYSDTFKPLSSDMSKDTGLSSKAIEVLNQLKNNDEDQAWKNVALINEILEGLYGADKDAQSLFSMIYDYTHPDEIFTSKKWPDHNKYSSNLIYLIRASIMDNISSWLHTHVKKKPKDELMTFENPEEYEKWYKAKQKKDRH